jgi:streptogramin lyase
MSDFVTELRREVLDAHARHRGRRPVERLAHAGRALLPPGRVLAPALVALGLLLVALRALPSSTPVAPPPRVLGVVPVGGTPLGMAYGDGSLWIADFNGGVVRVDPRTHRVLARIRVGGRPDSIASGPAGIWCRVEHVNDDRSDLVRVDPSTNRVTVRIAAGGGAIGSPSVAVGAGAVWVLRDYPSAASIDRIDPRTRRVTARLSPFEGVGTIAISGDSVWAMLGNGTLAQIDAHPRILRRWPALAPSGGYLAPDAGGVWAMDNHGGDILRVADGRVTRRIRVGAGALSLLARSDDGLWIVAAGHQVRRIDPGTGRVTGRVDLAGQSPTALAAAGRRLAVATSGGYVLLIG